MQIPNTVVNAVIRLAGRPEVQEQIKEAGKSIIGLLIRVLTGQ